MLETNNDSLKYRQKFVRKLFQVILLIQAFVNDEVATFYIWKLFELL